MQSFRDEQLLAQQELQGGCAGAVQPDGRPQGQARSESLSGFRGSELEAERERRDTFDFLQHVRPICQHMGVVGFPAQSAV